MELIKVKCYECGSEYPVPFDMPTCHCRECRSSFVENVPLGKCFSVILVTRNPSLGVIAYES